MVLSSFLLGTSSTPYLSCYSPPSLTTNSSSFTPISFLKPHPTFNYCYFPELVRLISSSPACSRTPNPLLALRSPSALAIDFDDHQLIQESSNTSLSPSSTATSPRDTHNMLPKIDKSGRFCSPRAARELALLILYASCLEGSDPVRLFEKRINARREPGYDFDKESLVEYNHMSFAGPPVTANTLEEADELLLHDQKESEIEAEVLSAPPKLVYSKLILRFTRKLLVAVAEKWDSHVFVIDKVAPPNWKNEPAARILELSILHLAMSEIAVLGTRHQIVINEAVDLAKRFCDGAAPRIINGCLRTFIKDLQGTSAVKRSS
ncbi:uncharacterized protein [Coffea arabica]|nr:uncharacterized protein LOC113696972 [Coffea arabica]